MVFSVDVVDRAMGIWFSDPLWKDSFGSDATYEAMDRMLVEMRDWSFFVQNDDKVSEIMVESCLDIWFGKPIWRDLYDEHPIRRYVEHLFHEMKKDFVVESVKKWR